MKNTWQGGSINVSWVCLHVCTPLCCCYRQLCRLLTWAGFATLQLWQKNLSLDSLKGPQSPWVLLELAATRGTHPSLGLEGNQGTPPADLPAMDELHEMPRAFARAWQCWGNTAGVKGPRAPGPQPSVSWRPHQSDPQTNCQASQLTDVKIPVSHFHALTQGGFGVHGSTQVSTLPHPAFQGARAVLSHPGNLLTGWWSDRPNLVTTPSPIHQDQDCPKHPPTTQFLRSLARVSPFLHLLLKRNLHFASPRLHPQSLPSVSPHSNIMTNHGHFPSCRSV